jgi:hypothetical protein
MLFNPLNPLLKRLLVASGNFGRINQVSHNLIVGLFLVGVDGFYFEVESILSSFDSLKTFSQLVNPQALLIFYHQNSLL